LTIEILELCTFMFFSHRLSFLKKHFLSQAFIFGHAHFFSFNFTIFCGGRYIVFWNSFIFDMKISKFIKYYTNMCWSFLCITLIKKYLNNLENIMNILNHVCFVSHEYVVWVTTFFQCVSLIELNARRDKWLVTIQVLP